jgi:hypothetical protein
VQSSSKQIPGSFGWLGMIAGGYPAASPLNIQKEVESNAANNKQEQGYSIR